MSDHEFYVERSHSANDRVKADGYNVSANGDLTFWHTTEQIGANPPEIQVVFSIAAGHWTTVKMEF